MSEKQMVNESNLIPNIRLGDDANKELIEGINILCDTVSQTFGPNGKNVIIQTEHNDVLMTKDGATVAQHTKVGDDYYGFRNLGIETVRRIAMKTAKDVGDGTTSSVVLANKIINSYKNYEGNPIELTRQLEKYSKEVISILEKYKLDITDYNDYLKVATISANNDPVIGKLVADAFYKVGKYGIVNFEESQETETTIEYIPGIKIESGYVSPFFINAENNTCELENVLVKVFDFKIEENKQIKEIVDIAIKSNKNLLLIAPKFNSTIIQSMIYNNGRVFDCCCITSPNHGIYREQVLSDLDSILGQSKTCAKVVITKEETTLIGCEGVSEEVRTKMIKTLSSKMSCPANPYEPVFYAKRLANYAGGVANILIGGYSKLEINEKKDRIEDAIHAVKAALLGGVLPGGGVALMRTSKLGDFDSKFANCICEPYMQLRNNLQYSDLSDELNSDDFWSGLNLKNNNTTLVNLYESGVLDPFLVTKTIIENAITAASLILTTNCAIINNQTK